MTNANTVSSTWDRPFKPPESIPDAADVVVIGGGIVGVSTAWFLAKQGVRVVLCEKGHIAGEQSGRNWGWVRIQGRDTRERIRATRVPVRCAKRQGHEVLRGVGQRCGRVWH
jgi:glycine/D-amino acid oxidase-like deaminating enzyme